MKSEPFASIDGAEGVGIRASSGNLGSEHSPSFRLARVFISHCRREIAVVCAILSATRPKAPAPKNALTLLGMLR